MITKNLVEQVSFKRPTDFHIDYISLFISLRTQNALKWLKRDGSNIILKTEHVTIKQLYGNKAATIIQKPT